MQNTGDNRPGNQRISGAEWLGITRDVVNMGSTGAGMGFNIARKRTKTGFGIATSVLDGLSAFGDRAVGRNPVSMILTGVSGIVEASGKATDASLQASQAITHASFRATSNALRSGGGKDGDLLKAMGVESEMADMIMVVIKMVAKFMDGLDCDPSIINDLYLLSSIQQRAGMHTPPTDNLVHRQQQIKDVQKYVPNALAAYGKQYCDFLGINLTESQLSRKEDIAHQAEIEDIIFISEMCKIEAEDIIEHKTDNSTYDPSYFIAIDRPNNAVLVSFRGTNSVSDLLVDLICDHLPYEIFGTKGFVHKGFIESVKRLSPRLEPLIYSSLSKLNQEKPLSIIITGHSLGGAMATLLSVHWLVSGIFTGIDLQCYSYAAPCVFSYQLSIHPSLKRFIKSIVFRDDLVPRLCLGSAFEVRGRILKIQELRRESPDEYNNLLSLIKEGKEIGNAAALYKLLEPDEEPKMRLYPAGTIYYSSHDENAENTLIRHVPQEFLAEIMLSVSMLSDHMPQAYAKLIN